MLLGLLDVLLSLLCIIESCSRVSVNFDQIGSLIVDLGVDLLGNIIDISHKLFNVVKLFLSLFNHIFHVCSLTLNLQLLHIELHRARRAHCASLGTSTIDVVAGGSISSAASP